MCMSVCIYAALESYSIDFNKTRSKHINHAIIDALMNPKYKCQGLLSEAAGRVLGERK